MRFTVSSLATVDSALMICWHGHLLALLDLPGLELSLEYVGNPVVVFVYLWIATIIILWKQLMSVDPRDPRPARLRG